MDETLAAGSRNPNLKTLQETHLMSLSWALWHPDGGHLRPSAEYPGAPYISQWSNSVLMANVCAPMRLLKKGFESLKAGTIHPHSREDWSSEQGLCSMPKAIMQDLSWPTEMAQQCLEHTFYWCSSKEPKAVCSILHPTSRWYVL